MGVSQVSMKILIAGFGSIGRRHFRNLKALGVQEFVFLRSRRSTLPDDEIAAYPVETDMAAALVHRPDAAVVANPTALRLEVAIPAAQAGCHLFLEKPLSHSLEGVTALQAAVERAGVRVFVGFQFRFHPGLRLIRQILAPFTPRSDRQHPSPDLGAQLEMPATGLAIGRPLCVRAHWGEYLPGWHPWEDYRNGYSARADLGGGVVLTLCHPLDYLRWLFGEVESLWAMTGKLGDLQLDVEDTAEIGLRFASGMIGSVHLDYNQRPPAHRLEVIGTQGTIQWDSAGGVVVHAVADSSQDEKIDFYAIDPPAGFERNTLFMDEMRHFLSVARGEAQPICTLEDGLQALRLAFAVHRSVQCAERVMVASQ